MPRRRPGEPELQAATPVPAIPEPDAEGYRRFQAKTHLRFHQLLPHGKYRRVDVEPDQFVELGPEDEYVNLAQLLANRLLVPAPKGADEEAASSG